MSCKPLTDRAAPMTRATGDGVWDQLWRTHPSDARDDALLDRERRGPRWNMIVKRLESTFGSIGGLKTIELGSGRGDLSVLLAERGARVTLLDASDRALALAGQRFNRLGLAATYEQADLLGTQSPLRGRFDLALSSGVIEHFKGLDRTRAIQAHYDAVRPGGLALISVPNAWCIPYRVWKLYLELRGWWPYGMEMPYGRRELIRRARKVGFAHTEIRCFGFWQSISSHWARSIFRFEVDWSNWLSRFDSVCGSTLLLFARHGEELAAGRRLSNVDCRTKMADRQSAIGNREPYVVTMETG